DQLWVVPDESGGDPGYDQREIDQAELTDNLVVVAGGKDLYPDRAATRIRNRSSALLASRLGPGRSIVLPDAPYVHLYVPLGSAELEGEGGLVAGDAAGRTASGGRRIACGPGGAVVLVWEMHEGMTMLDVRGH